MESRRGVAPLFNKDGDERISDTQVDHFQPETEHDVATDDGARPWRVGTRIAFRFCFVYFGLFCLTFAQITVVYAGVLARWFPDHAVLWQMVLLDPVTGWVGRTVLGVDTVLHPDSGSGNLVADLQSARRRAGRHARLVGAVLIARPAQLTTRPRLFSSGKRNRMAAVVSVALGVWVVADCVVLNVQVWREAGGGTPKPELYGIWEVTEFSLDGTPRPPLTTDEIRWKGVIFDSPGVVTYQRGGHAQMATLAVDRSASDRLRLDGVQEQPYLG
jgi:hypothetical protein